MVMPLVITLASNTASPDVPKGTLSYRLRICAPQLLHIDLSGRPRWFKGGVVKGPSEASRSENEYQAFRSFMVEQSDLQEGINTAWKPEQDNVYCLTSPLDRVFHFNLEEERALDMIVSQARKIDAGVESS